MPNIKLGEISIASERLGFPASATPTADEAGLKLLDALDERDALREKIGLLQGEVKILRRNEQALREVERDLVLSDAKAAFKIDAVEIPLLREMWAVNPAAVREHLGKLRPKAHLTQEVGIRGDEGSPTDVAAEVAAAAAALMASDKTLTLSDAQFRVLADNPELSRRYREKQVAGARKEG